MGEGKGEGELPASQRAATPLRLPSRTVKCCYRFLTETGMSKNFDQGKAEVAALCNYFAKNRAAFCAPGRKEAHVRQDLIDPLFRALGWDVGNAGRVAPQYCEVVVEDSLDVEGQNKAPDYTFRVGTLPKFYVEAKKCGVNINADPAPAEYQQGQLPCLPRRRCVCGPF